MSLQFDIEKSLELCPPDKRMFPKTLSQESIDEMVFVERKIIPKDKVTFRMKDQIRSLGSVPENVYELKVSLETHGYIHSEYPPIVVEDDDKVGYYNGISGFNRDHASDVLGEKYFMYDVYSFKSPLAKFYMKTISNHIYNPKKGNTKEDLIHLVLKAIEDGIIENDDDALKRHIGIIAADKSVGERKNILKGVRSYKTKFSHLRTYHCGESGAKSTKTAAKKHGLGWGGDKNLADTGKLGYIPPYGKPITALAQSENLLKKYSFTPIEFTFFIPEPSPEPKLTQDRLNKLREFEEAKSKKMEFYQVLLAEFGVHKSIKEIEEKIPMHVLGFLPQHENPDPTKGGRPTEDTIVDAYGVPVDRTKV
jgi:hypothetical protein